MFGIDVILRWWFQQMIYVHKIWTRSLVNFGHLFNPAILIGVYYVIFGVILDANRGVENFIGFLVVGVIILISRREVSKMQPFLSEEISL